ncbi:sigma-70 family RNA polymerase sigma factor [Rudanella paleaurantiibacter]|uniref:Sigma-70 family RNA polymerase sigma factor n=1 Tax=Rudanella paleaurantiibacter TaxID=2614655 RepID=A0A7J5U3E0_9BACT|nr:sigma-70 family RNA polymerase sigma factor [Rudanella paleaurantiibacter]KAB7732201.1 sigma-70 family RNA polymerase sigma factor [Rudanella paleaurantiibacter]
MKQLSDEELVRLYVETQRNQYFEALYVRYCDKVYRKCLSFTKDPAKAEDFTHDIFLKLITKLGGFKEQAKFSTWLFSVTYNYCTDHTRVRRGGEVLADNMELLPDYGDSDEAEVAEMEAAGLRKAMDRLNADERSLLMMKYQDDFSIRDIADMSNITESAVKMRLKRAKDKLRKHYLEGIVMWLLLALKYITTKWPLRF